MQPFRLRKRLLQTAFIHDVAVCRIAPGALYNLSQTSTLLLHGEVETYSPPTSQTQRTEIGPTICYNQLLHTNNPHSAEHRRQVSGVGPTFCSTAVEIAYTSTSSEDIGQGSMSPFLSPHESHNICECVLHKGEKVVSASRCGGRLLNLEVSKDPAAGP
jgi:hypothetical protein